MGPERRPQPAVVLTPASAAAGPAVVLKEGPCGERPEKRPDESSQEESKEGATPERRPEETSSTDKSSSSTSKEEDQKKQKVESDDL